MANYEPRQRTALDGRVWWCVFDITSGRWSTLLTHGKYHTKKEAQYAIDKVIKGKEKFGSENICG